LVVISANLARQFFLEKKRRKKKKKELFCYIVLLSTRTIMSTHSGEEPDIDIKEQDRFLPIAK
jgi:hypothetical protein